MRVKAFSTLTLGVGLGVLGVQLAACSNSADDCTATASCGTSGNSTTAGTSGKNGGGSGAEGGADSGGSSSGGSQGNSGTSGNGGGGGTNGAECNGDVANDPTCWTTNDLGVFVSSDTGDDTEGDGTKEKPYASISKAIGAAAGKNVYVCLGVAEAYEEKITITDAERDGVKIYGGFSCSDWTHDVARYVTVESPENIALRIQNATSVHIENVRFFAADAAGANFSSYGAFITDSQGVVLRRVEITAGAGQKGADGDPGAAPVNAAVAGDDQNGDGVLCGGPPDDGEGGSWPPAGTCGSKGGKGGDGAPEVDGSDGVSGTPLSNVTPANLDNSGQGATADNTPGGDGSPGSNGNAGSSGQAAAAVGSFTATSFTPAKGGDGTDGFPGQGGGGGGASKGTATCRGASGGAGGMGGCGGKLGHGGGGGGASVGLFSWNSGVTLEVCTIRSGIGGAGGAGGKAGGGGAGANGGAGGPANVGEEIARGGNGGPGGNGGNGGSGSGGSGGPSFAMVFSGTKPVYEPAETTLTAGSGGAAGPGGKIGQAQAVAGSVGASESEYEIP